MSQPTANSGRKSPNYKNHILLEIIKGIEPAGRVDWERVAVRYQENSNEAVLRDYQDIKRHFIQKMCNSQKKVTGESSAVKLVQDSQNVYERILRKEGAGNYNSSPAVNRTVTAAPAPTRNVDAVVNDGVELSESASSNSDEDSSDDEKSADDGAVAPAARVAVAAAGSAGAGKTKNSRPKNY